MKSEMVGGSSVDNPGILDPRWSFYLSPYFVGQVGVLGGVGESHIFWGLVLGLRMGLSMVEFSKFLRELLRVFLPTSRYSMIFPTTVLSFL